MILKAVPGHRRRRAGHGHAGPAGPGQRHEPGPSPPRRTVSWPGRPGVTVTGTVTVALRVSQAVQRFSRPRDWPGPGAPGPCGDRDCQCQPGVGPARLPPSESRWLRYSESARLGIVASLSLSHPSHGPLAAALRHVQVRLKFTAKPIFEENQLDGYPRPAGD